MVIGAAVGEGVGRHVENAHDEGALTEQKSAVFQPPFVASSIHIASTQWGRDSRRGSPGSSRKRVRRRPTSRRRAQATGKTLEPAPSEAGPEGRKHSPPRRA